jgi:hypothetical protein
MVRHKVNIIRSEIEVKVNNYMRTYNSIKTGQQVKTERDIPSVNGMLYENTIVTVDEIGFPDKNLRVKDKLGKIWYVNFSDISVSF